MKGGGFWHAILLLIVASVIMGVIQLAIVLLIVWGLITRPLQTAGALLLLALLQLINRYPVMGICILFLIALASFLPDRGSSARAAEKSLLPAPEDRP